MRPTSSPSAPFTSSTPRFQRARCCGTSRRVREKKAKFASSKALGRNCACVRTK